MMALPISGFSGTKPEEQDRMPLFQLGGGIVHSSIDLSRYNSSVAYRGLHLRLATHIYNKFYLSTEYSTFPTHNSPASWDQVTTRKFDFNGHLSFFTENRRTRIFVLAGANKHEWSGRRTRFTDLDQLGKGIKEGTYVHVRRWGVNFGCGISQELYDNLGFFGDFRFNFSNAHNAEKVRIMDVMTTFGIQLTIPHPQKDKKYGIGKKIYKWTRKGGS